MKNVDKICFAINSLYNNYCCYVYNMNHISVRGYGKILWIQMRNILFNCAGLYSLLRPRIPVYS